MLCERCKIREANIQYTEIVNGVKTEHHFCAQCAKELDFGPYSAIFEGDFPLGKLLSGLLGVGETNQKDKVYQVICPTCGTSYEEFVKNSRFGCPDCYGVFDLLIAENIRQLQGSDTHKGKKPRFGSEKEKLSWEQDSDGNQRPKLSSQEQLLLLQAKLQEALRQEDYETAARYRDQIRELRKEIEEC